MKIGIIGAGHIGSVLARKLSAAGHTILLANSRGPETIRDLAAEAGATAQTAEAAVKDVKIIILSIPFGRLPAMKELLALVPEDVVVADTSNYYPVRDGHVAAVDEGQVESVWVSKQLGRPVVKAWNSIFAESLANKGNSPASEGRIALPVAGDDEKAKQQVMRLVDATGFDALDAGPLSESWRQQPGTAAYCTDLEMDALRDALARADRANAPKRRDLSIEHFMTAGNTMTNDERVQFVRELKAN